MVNFGLATDTNDARSVCYVAFQTSPEYSKHESDLQKFLVDVVAYFSEMSD